MAYRCRGCGEINTIVEIDFTPRIFGVSPGDNGPDPDFELGIDEVLWEGAHIIGYGCNAEPDCQFWQGNYGYGDEAPDIEEVAEVVEEEEV